MSLREVIALPFKYLTILFAFITGGCFSLMILIKFGLDEGTERLSALSKRIEGILKDAS